MLAELRHEAAVVDLGMGQEQEVDPRGPERERPVVELADALRTLEYAAVPRTKGAATTPAAAFLGG